MYTTLKNNVYKANMLLPKYNLIDLTWGNVSEVDRTLGVMAIKPSGIKYEELTSEDIVVVELAGGRVVSGELRPSSDLKTHLELYKAFPEIGAVVHTHSRFATAFAQAEREIEPYGTTHADTFYGPVPCTRRLTSIEVDEDYEVNTGKVIKERFTALDYKAVPAVLVASHGVFTWGGTGEKAVENALVVERVAEMALNTAILGGKSVIDTFLLDKHYNRKHGKNAYYGQKK